MLFNWLLLWYILYNIHLLPLWTFMKGPESLIHTAELSAAQRCHQLAACQTYQLGLPVPTIALEAGLDLVYRSVFSQYLCCCLYGMLAVNLFQICIVYSHPSCLLLWEVLLGLVHYTARLVLSVLSSNTLMIDAWQKLDSND